MLPGKLAEIPDSMKGHLDDYWQPGKTVLGNYSNAIEVVETEFFETVGSVSHHEVKWIRLVWTDFNGAQPDRNIAVFNFEELLPFLKLVSVPNPRQGPEISVADLLKMRQFKGIRLAGTGKPDGANGAVWEYKNFLWPDEE